jgi:hypothetical protein
MLRLMVLILLVANGLYLAWSQGLLKTYGWAPAQQTEPQRQAQQIHPERMRILGTEDQRRPEARASQISPTPPRPAECLQAGLFDERQSETLRKALTPALPAGSWALESGMEPNRWIVYMGKYADNEAMNRKLAELRARGLNIRFEPLLNPALAPGLSLGGYPTEAAARDALAELANRGVRTARVVQERAEVRGQWLRLPLADTALKQRLDTLKPALAGKPLRPCP